MDRILIIDSNKKVGEKIKVCGWIQVRRDHGKIIFLDILDRSGVIQVIANQEQAGKLRAQDVVCIEGKVSKRPENLVNPNLETGAVELQAEKIAVLSKAEELPFDMGAKELNLQLPTLLDFRPLTLRHQSNKDIFKVQASLLNSFRETAKNFGCTEIVVPTIAVSSTEGGAEVFKVNYYGYNAYLTQSPQLYKQMLVPVFERVSVITKAYRAEPSVTTRHLTESTQLDCEFGFADFNELLDILEAFSVQMLKKAAGDSKDILDKYNIPQPKIDKVPRLKMREAQEIIYKEYGRDVRNENDLGPQDEVDICKWVEKEHGSELVIITHYPTKKRPFYTKPDPDNPEYSLSFDVLFRGMEILSGSQRINDYEQLVGAIKDRGMDPKDFEMYLMAFKYGMPPEGGFSFGLERMTMHILKLSNVREASLFPRDMERVDVRLSTLK